MHQGLSALPHVQLLAGEKPQVGLLAFTVRGWHPLDVAAQLDVQGIAVRAGHHCAQPLMTALGMTGGSVRSSVAVYNTLEDVDALVASLARMRRPGG